MTKKYQYTKKPGRPRKIKDVEELEMKIENYFKDCDEKKEPYTITGLAIAVGLYGRKELIEYQEREEYTNTIKKAKARVEQWWVNRLSDGRANPAGPIFILKNDFDFRDVVDLQHAGPGGEPFDIGALELAVKISSLLEIARRRKEEQEAQKKLPEKIGGETK